MFLDDGRKGQSNLLNEFIDFKRGTRLRDI